MVGKGVHELVLLDQAGQALAEASSFEQIKDIRDKAEAVRKYAQSASLGLDIQNRAAEVKLQAERQAGKLLSQLALRGGDRRSKSCSERLKLGDLGISRNQSTRWQIQAKVPENIFRDYIRQTCEAGKELTSANLMRLAKRWDEPIGHQPANDKNGHSANGHGKSYLDRFRPRDDQSPLANMAEIVGELRNHHQVLDGILKPIYQAENVTLRPAERRVLQYLLTETRDLFSRLDSLQHKLTECACHREHGKT